MDDLISRQAAIDVADKYLDADGCNGSDIAMDILGDLMNLPSAEPQLVNESQGLVKDLVNREGALCSIEQYIDKFDFIDSNFLDGLKTAMELIKELPSAEPQIIACGEGELSTNLAEVGTDLISRQQAIHAFLTELTKRERKNLLHTWSTVEVKYFITNMMEQLPSAQPERKGKWITHKRTDLGKKLNHCIECSECGVWFSACELLRTSYCPNCGAKMEVEHEAD